MRRKRCFRILQNVMFCIAGFFFLHNSFAADVSNTLQTYAPAVKLAAPSVVNIFTKRQHISRSSEDDRFAPPSNINRDSSKITLGSGVIIDKAGYILTNYHVVRRLRQIMVALMDGRTAQAKLIGVDEDSDLAVLKIGLTNLQPITIANSEQVQVGDVVLAIGNPFGLGQTVTQGIVSAVGRNTIGLNSLENYIQTDAAINPGNSGGALINTQGKLIGINTGIYTRSGGYQGVGFAIPSNGALNVMQQLIKTGVVKRGWLGVEVMTLDSDLATTLKTHKSTGVVVDEVMAKSPAEKAGIKRNDILVSVDGRIIRSARGFLNIIAQRQPGDNVSLKVVRNNKEHVIELKLAPRPKPGVLDDRALPQAPDSHGRSGSRGYIPDDRR